MTTTKTTLQQDLGSLAADLVSAGNHEGAALVTSAVNSLQAQTAPAVAGEAMQPCMVELQDELWRAHAKKVLSDVRQVIKDDALHGAFADGFDCAIDEIKHRLFAAPPQGAKQ